MDHNLPARPISMGLVSARGHYQAVVQRVVQARHSVWIATANLKQLMASAGPEQTGDKKRPMTELLAGLADRGVELRILHARLPSLAFRQGFDAQPALVRGGLELRQCPRVHLKAVIVDGSFLYLGSANWTGAAMGLRASTRRNFELGLVTDDPLLLDQIQELYQSIWSGQLCGPCTLKACEAPLDLEPPVD